MNRHRPFLLSLSLSAAVHALAALPGGEHPWRFSARQENPLSVQFVQELAIPPSASGGSAAALSYGGAVRPPVETRSHPQRDRYVALADTQRGSGQPNDGAAAKEQTQAEVEARLRTQLARHFVYPELARQRGWEGKVVLRLRVVPPGTVNRIQVARSSGYYVIDQAAVRALERAELSGSTALSQSFEMELPIVYRLRGG